MIIPQDKQEHWLLAKGRAEVERLIRPNEGDLKGHRTVEVTKIRGEDTDRPDIQDEF